MTQSDSIKHVVIFPLWTRLADGRKVSGDEINKEAISEWVANKLLTQEDAAILLSDLNKEQQ